MIVAIVYLAFCVCREMMVTFIKPPELFYSHILYSDALQIEVGQKNETYIAAATSLGLVSLCTHHGGPSYTRR